MNNFELISKLVEIKLIQLNEYYRKILEIQNKVIASGQLWICLWYCRVAIAY